MGVRSPLLAFARDSLRESGALSQQDNSLVSCLQTFEDQSLNFFQNRPTRNFSFWEWQLLQTILRVEQATEIPLVVLFSFLALPPLQFKLPAFRSQVLEQCQARPGRGENVSVTDVASPKMSH